MQSALLGLKPALEFQIILGNLLCITSRQKKTSQPRYPRLPTVLAPGISCTLFCHFWMFLTAFNVGLLPGNPFYFIFIFIFPCGRHKTHVSSFLLQGPCGLSLSSQISLWCKQRTSDFCKFVLNHRQKKKSKNMHTLNLRQSKYPALQV